MIKWEVKNHEGSEYTTYCSFNDGYSHLAVDDGCWLILNGGKPARHIFPEAAMVLSQVPFDPVNYLPFRQFLGMRE